MSKEYLVRWINDLIKQDKVHLFYHSKEWLHLKKEVLKEQHYECQECLKQGILTKAYTVHHINYVKNRPDLALSKTYVDDKGIERMQLESVCEECHNKLHNRFTKKMPLTEEWW